METPHPLHRFDAVPEIDNPFRVFALEEVAESESNEIVTSAARQVHDVIERARREIDVLRTQVGATVAAVDDPGERFSRPTPALSAETLGLLARAREEFDAFFESVDVPPRPVKPRLRRDRHLAAMVTGVCGLAMAVLAAGDMTPSAPMSVAVGTSGTGLATAAGVGPPHGRGDLLSVALPRPGEPGSGARRVVQQGLSATGDLNTPPGSEAAVSGVASTASDSKESLQLSAERWLLAYFADGQGASPGARPTVHDARRPGDRADGTAATRVVAPSRIEVFGDAAVLTTSVTETLAGASRREVVSLVSQLWTRIDGRWRLDEVRILDARRAQSDFRR